MLQLYWPTCGMQPISDESEWNESEAGKNLFQFL